MIERFQVSLAHGVTLSCRAAGTRGRPTLVFLHGFPEAAFVWDELLVHFAHPDHGGYRCVAPNLRGYENSSQPADVADYRPKHLVQDIAALIATETGDHPLECLIAHDWGGAIAWNLMNQQPQLSQRLAIINSPHPGTFLRELKHNPRQQAASAYMNFLVRPDAEQLLRHNDYQRLWAFFTNGPQGAPWLTDAVRQHYRDVWDTSLTGGCNYYRASPLRPARSDDPGATAVDLPHSMLTVNRPTLVLWGMDDVALAPELIEGLDQYIPDLTLEKIENASHWIVHENPSLVAARLAAFLERSRAHQ